MAEKLTKEKYTDLVLELAKKGMSSEKIGLLIKKEHKIVPRSFEKIGKILKKHNITNQPDKENLRKKVKILEKHSSSHKQDQTFRRSLYVKTAKLKKLDALK